MPSNQSSLTAKVPGGGSVNRLGGEQLQHCLIHPARIKNSRPENSELPRPFRADATKLLVILFRFRPGSRHVAMPEGLECVIVGRLRVVVGAGDQVGNDQEHQGKLQPELRCACTNHSPAAILALP